MSVATWKRDGQLVPCGVGSGASPLEDARAALRSARSARAPRALVLVLDEATTLFSRAPAALLARSPMEVIHALRPEAESALARRVGHKPIGSLLVLAGATEAGRVVARLADQAQRARSRQEVPLLGSLLRDGGDVADKDLERALTRQAWFAATDEVVMGYAAERAASASARVDLFAVALSAPCRAQWLQVAREHGFEVAAILAHDTAPLAAVPNEDFEGAGLLLHVGSAWAQLLRWDASQRLEVSTVLSTSAAFDAEELLGLIRVRPGERVVLAAESAADRVLVDELAARIEGARTLAQAHEDPAAAMLGAAYLLREPSRRFPLAILGRGNLRDPRRFQVVLRSCGALALVAGAAVGAEYWIEARAERAGETVRALGEERRALQAEQGRVTAANRERQALLQELRELEPRVRLLEQRHQRLAPIDTSERPSEASRRRLLSATLAGLRHSTHGRIQVTRVNTSETGLLELEALAVDGQAAQRFSQSFSERLADVGWRPGRAEVRPFDAAARSQRLAQRLVQFTFLPPEVP